MAVDGAFETFFNGLSSLPLFLRDDHEVDDDRPSTASIRVALGLSILHQPDLIPCEDSVVRANVQLDFLSSLLGPAVGGFKYP